MMILLIKWLFKDRNTDLSVVYTYSMYIFRNHWIHLNGVYNLSYHFRFTYNLFWDILLRFYTRVALFKHFYKAVTFICKYIWWILKQHMIQFLFYCNYVCMFVKGNTTLRFVGKYADLILCEIVLLYVVIKGFQNIFCRTVSILWLCSAKCASFTNWVYIIYIQWIFISIS